MIKTSTPVRIDLAGGTLDIYPVYLLEDGAYTVNAAIDLRCEVTIKESRDFVIESLDLQEKITAKDYRKLSLDGKLGFVLRAVNYFAPKTPFHLTTKNPIPAGSGLGASSSLLMALFAALAEYTGRKMSLRQMVQLGAQMEAQSIGTLTGKQDYYSALYGGVSALFFGLAREKREELKISPQFKKQLEQSIILTYSGASHFSAKENWEMVKNYLDREPETVKRMKVIKECGKAMREALLKEDLAKAAVILDREWEARLGLAKGVETTLIKRLMAAARSAGAMAGKICGAGGGGCLITLVDAKKKKPVEEALQKAGGKVLSFSFAELGLIKVVN